MGTGGHSRGLTGCQETYRGMRKEQTEGEQRSGGVWHSKDRLADDVESPPGMGNDNGMTARGWVSSNKLLHN